MELDFVRHIAYAKDGIEILKDETNEEIQQ